MAVRVPHSPQKRCCDPWHSAQAMVSFMVLYMDIPIVPKACLTHFDLPSFKFEIKLELW